MEKRIFSADTIDEAQNILEYFNGFHDGFIKSLSVISKDSFVNRGEQIYGGSLSLEIVFAHYNYQAETTPFNQIVKATFEDVKTLKITFSGESCEWTIYSLTFSKSFRFREELSVNNKLPENEKCLKAILTQKRLNENDWILNEDLSFTFVNCRFQEL